ncbi:DNA polymerase III polC-type [Caldalkalibacillus thermarum TA2.A1]|uniref:DNA polymerase III PolC-type n=1 Tax=Caldalkalibacillus thermarum (strain TA2.A1) TaxID=986075 RepID=F5L4K3_CALTT|nr:PolC-type DNA polymerase III [Caldalkalibacillus thermarum]EGL83720.1 DNA polymerase III polC-type [Caldalkalibacillus thermarum TA2.A1]QZT32987.1 PolC-type DNA polymerase III [Caldalkalibacillus thermarum TA2.A1]
MATEVKVKRERLLILLEQLEIPADIQDTYFKEAYIDKLQLIEREKRWLFHFVLEKPFPPSIYQLFSERLRNTFSHLAEVRFVFRFTTHVKQASLFYDYWPEFLREHRHRLNGIYKRLESFPPELKGNTIVFSVFNEVEKGLYQKKVEPLLKEFYQQFMDFNPKAQYVIEEAEAAYQQFIEAREKEDQARAQQAVQQTEQEKAAETREKQKPAATREIIGYAIKEDPVPLKTIHEEEKSVVVQGYVFDLDLRELKSGRTLLTMDITDYTDSITVKVFSKGKEDIEAFQAVQKGMWVKVRGSVQLDTFQRELVLMAYDINKIEKEGRKDTHPEKRVELHLHTNMSAMDGVTSITNYVKQAAEWGHPALAVTDHGVAQAFPEAFAAGQKHGVKIIYGLEAYVVDDGVPIVYNPKPCSLKDETYVVFDVETTGLSAVYNKIIELAAVKIRNGEVIDKFSEFANPHEPLTDQIVKLTGITDDMLKDAPEIEDVLRRFYDFVGDATLVAHNASFDMGFLQVGYKKLGLELNNAVIDTLELARFLYPDLKNHRLNTLCKLFNIELVNHHRAVYDAEATGYLLWKMISDCQEREITQLDQLNEYKGSGDVIRQRPFHCTLLAKTQQGLKNLYKLISLAHIKYFHRTPRIPRSLIEQYREGLLVGSACDQGEIFEGMMQKSPEEVEEIAKFYDYFEIQPVSNYEHLIEKELVKDKAHIQTILSNIVKLGDKLGKPVVATGNVHYLHPEEAIYRKILVTTLGGATPLDPNRLPLVYFRTTDEMLEEFQFLGAGKAEEVVIKHPQSIADQIEEIRPVPAELYTPHIEGADEDIRRMCYDKAKQIYGDPLPDIVEKRLEKELNSIINNGFSVIYLISQKLVHKSLQDGYLVGSRGSVGSSFVATMLEITEVNPLPPHYVCPNCHYSQFFDDGSVGSGFDLPAKDCPECGHRLIKDGHDIPFETFLGFKGDKVPDIDLNFSGEYQPIAHKYTQELFGEDKVYRAGTIGTVADKTAYGFVKKYEEIEGKTFRQAEINRLAKGCTGVKRTTGQHPGGIIVVPEDKEIYDFTPIQYPADDMDSEWRTTHFDFHSIHDNLLKLDILGHDDPTVIRMLQDLTGINPKEIPIDDPETMKIFSSTEPLGVTEEQIMSKTGTLGIPEFGTRFVRQMLEDTRPTTFAELVRISGLSHGTDVWLNNAQELIREGKAVLSEVISTRDDIMVYLIHKGLEPSRAFKIMERVRKGKGLEEDDINEMKKHGVPDWYIWSCQKIKYMFPKAHAVAYVLMAVRIAYFKVHYPIQFYASYFTVRADDFDVQLALKGSQAIRKKIEEILEKGNQAQPKEKSLLTVLELCLEMVERGFHFKNVDLYRSDAIQFLVDGDGLIPPFNAIPGIGTNAALSIVKARNEGEFLSKEDLQIRSKVSKTVIDYLEQHGCLKDLPETNQLSLF